jgi:hypothetical protein
MYLSPLETAMLLKSVSVLSSEIFFRTDVIDGMTGELRSFIQ